MIIVNTPHNPVGKVFTKSELESIAAIAEEFNLLVMADEVVCRHYFASRYALKPFLSQYDCLVFDGKEHVRIANLPGMWDRTVTVGSAGSMKSIAPQCLHVYQSINRGICGYWMAHWLVNCPEIYHPAHFSRKHAHCLLYQLPVTRSRSLWSGTSQRPEILRDTTHGIRGTAENSL